MPSFGLDTDAQNECELDSPPVSLVLGDKVKDIVTVDLAGKLGIARNLLWKRFGHLNKKLFRFPSLSTSSSSICGAAAKTKNFPNRAMSEKAFPIARPAAVSRAADITLMRRNSPPPSSYI